MKKIKTLYFIVFVTLLISGCSSFEQSNGSPLTPNSTPTPGTEFEGEVDYTTLIPETDEIKAHIEKKFIHFPTNILVNFKDNEIRWFCDNGGGINQDLWTDEDTKVWIENERAIYKGVLIRLGEGIYASKGIFVPSMLNENTISESVDFYLLIEDNKATFVFEQASLEELETLEINSYYCHIEQ